MQDSGGLTVMHVRQLNQSKRDELARLYWWWLSLEEGISTGL
jgi:hypothetical protein